MGKTQPFKSHSNQKSFYWFMKENLSVIQHKQNLPGQFFTLTWHSRSCNSYLNDWILPQKCCTFRPLFITHCIFSIATKGSLPEICMNTSSMTSFLVSTIWILLGKLAKVGTYIASYLNNTSDLVLLRLVTSKKAILNMFDDNTQLQFESDCEIDRSMTK